MRTNLVGKSRVSAMTQMPASGPLGPVTVPPMSFGPTSMRCTRDGAMASSAATDNPDTARSRGRGGILMLRPRSGAQPIAENIDQRTTERQRGERTGLDTSLGGQHVSAFTTPDTRMRVRLIVMATAVATLLSVPSHGVAQGRCIRAYGTPACNTD